MTFREVHLAWQGKADITWMPTAEVMAAIYNIRPRGKRDTRNYKGGDFYHPTSGSSQRSRVTEGTRLTVGLLRSLKSAMFGIKEDSPCKSR